jgi:hypothetical protein
MRLISWMILGLLASLLPLAIVAAMADGTSASDFLRSWSNKELSAVAFTLSGAAAFAPRVPAIR